MNAQRTSGTRPRTARLAFLLGLGLVVAAAAPMSCGRMKTDSRQQRRAVASAPAERATLDEAQAPEGLAGTANESKGAGSASTLLATASQAASRRDIIYTGEMVLEVDDVEAATARIEEAARAAGGWLSSRQLGVDADGRRTASVAIRLPAAGFAGAHAALRGLGDVVRDATQARDVGMEFVDLEARLRNLEREEQVIAGLFSRGGRIGDVLQVERELARVRGEIEGIQGQLRYLREQVAYSTLTVTLMPKRPAIERRIERWNLGHHVLRAWRALVSLARMLTYGVIYVAIILGPLALLAWVVLRIVRAAHRGRSS